MEEVTRDLLVSVSAFAGIFGIVYVIVMTRFRERMAMLERGVDPSSFVSKGNKTATLKWGMLCVGVALGIIIGNALEESNVLEEEVAYLSMIFLFGGLSLILNYIIDRKIKD
jgi:hypothetical protein